MLAMLRGKPPRLLCSRPRPKFVFLTGLALMAVLMLMIRGSDTVYEAVPWGRVPPPPEHRPPLPEEDPKLQEQQEQERQRQAYESRENELRDTWKQEYKDAESALGASAIYGNTVASLVDKEKRKHEFGEALRKAGSDQTVPFTHDMPVYFNPYPDYNSEAWLAGGHAPYVPCDGPDGGPVEDILVFRGHPHDFPEPGFGSYNVLNMDGNLCFERDTRWGPYGMHPRNDTEGHQIAWEKVQWGRLQRQCVDRNKDRFRSREDAKNGVLSGGDGSGSTGGTASASASAKSHSNGSGGSSGGGASRLGEQQPPPVREQQEEPMRTDDDRARREGRPLGAAAAAPPKRSPAGPVKEPRTALLLRSFTGKKYTENDKQNIRALISELSLRSGGEYQVFLLVHVKEHQDGVEDILDDDEGYQRILHAHVPHEFHDMAVLWDDAQVWKIYTSLTDDMERSVHEAQWLSVQKFSRDFPEFDFIWNWEMDFRFTGQYYEMLNKLHEFGRKQPRRGLWERNERYYIPAHHGDYDTEFRAMVESQSGKDTVWGPIQRSFLASVPEPHPPVPDPRDDPYQWGVGEDADYVTLAPMFNPVGSKWIMWDHVWGYADQEHWPQDLPRRTTIVTHSRLSRRLLDTMHEEEMLGNHVASEMTPQTVSLLHGLKAVFAPHPVFFDRPWDGSFLNHWFNPGAGGVAGGEGSAMGWGRERRYEGSTWYYRAIPPNRLYNNWMGYADTGMGGPDWEAQHGRPCLPPIMLHPVKDVRPTEKDHATNFDLAFG